jgi:hypothetical protein
MRPGECGHWTALSAYIVANKSFPQTEDKNRQGLSTGASALNARESIAYDK